MIGIVFASEAEAAAFVARYGRGRFDGIAEGESQFDDDILVSIVGVGKIKATLRAERLLQEYRLTRIIHMGACLTLADEPAIGEIIAAEQVFEGDRVELAAPSYPRMPIDTAFDKLKAYRIVTQDRLVDGADEVGYWQRLAHVTDTTAYPLAYVSATHGVPLDIAKVVSGKAGEKRTEAAEVARGYEALAEFVIAALPDILSAAG